VAEWRAEIKPTVRKRVIPRALAGRAENKGIKNEGTTDDSF